MISAVTGVANSITLNIVGDTVKEKALYKGVVWTSGITAALGSWIFAGWMAYKTYGTYKDDETLLSATYFATSMTLLAAGGAALAATAQSVGLIRPGVSIGTFVINRAGWGLVAARLGWVGLALAVLTVILEKDQLEKWLWRCVFGKPGGPENFKSLQAALDNLGK